MRSRFNRKKFNIKNNSDSDILLMTLRKCIAFRITSKH